MKLVTKRKCKTCRNPIPPQETGRRSVYCSAACRQKAYRKRIAANPLPLRLLNNDLYGSADREARKKGAVRVLEELGYRVQLIFSPQQPKKAMSPKLKLVEKPEPPKK